MHGDGGGDDGGDGGEGQEVLGVRGVLVIKALREYTVEGRRGVGVKDTSES